MQAESTVMKIGSEKLRKVKWDEQHTSQTLLKKSLLGFGVKGGCDEGRESKLTNRQEDGKFLTYKRNQT